MIIFLILEIYKYSLHLHDFQNNLIVFQDTATFECYSFQCKETDPYNNPQARRLVLTLSVCSKDVAWQEKKCHEWANCSLQYIPQRELRGKWIRHKWWSDWLIERSWNIMTSWFTASKLSILGVSFLNDQRSHVVSSLFVVFCVSSVAEGELGREKENIRHFIQK